MTGAQSRYLQGLQLYQQVALSQQRHRQLFYIKFFAHSDEFLGF